MPNHNTNDKGEKGVPVTAHLGTGMDMRGDPQGCSRDFSGISPLCHHDVRSTSRTIPTAKTERQKSASRHPCLSEDNAHNGAAPLPLGSVSPRCRLRVHFLLFVCPPENSTSAMHHFFCPPKMQPPAVVAWPYLPESSVWYVLPEHILLTMIIGQGKSRPRGT